MATPTTEFIEFALESKVLQFGDFTLKSGRVSPYFFNAGKFQTGKALAKLGAAYAAAIRDSGIEFDVLYGPAYKGIPLVAATAVAFQHLYGIEVPYCFNRKEAKDHGEGGLIVGAPLTGRAIVIDDVITAGTALNEAMGILQQAGATPVGVVIALDRQERGKGELSAIQEAEKTYGVPVLSIIKMQNLITYLEEKGTESETVEKIKSYRVQYGVV
eukprot:GILK01004795.1.p1 GENE.GILK01004795.1~~GILK01004795.1.p1  ORF type:complete len:228 (-),score=39.44 GILK01004795.1:34-678(-)